MQRLIKIDGKVRTDPNYPAGFMGKKMKCSWRMILIKPLNKTLSIFHFIEDVVTIDKTGEHFRLIYDVKGRFAIHRISTEEAKVSSQCDHE